VQATLAGLARESATLRDTLAAAVQQQLDGVTARLDGTHTAAMQRLDDVLTRHTHEALAATVAGFEQHAATLLRGVEHTVQAITGQAEAHARATLDEIARLVQTASEAPRAAAEVVGQMRQALSDSLVRDNAALDERVRLLGTLDGLLDAITHAGTEQRAAIDALVQATTEVLDRVGDRFSETVESESQALQAVVVQVTGSAAEVASLGEGFGHAVQLFSSASEQLMAQLQRIESALGHSMARSDEQLAYYVAQAREIIDLTLGSQKQIVEDLQQLKRVPALETDAA